MSSDEGWRNAAPGGAAGLAPGPRVESHRGLRPGSEQVSEGPTGPGTRLPPTGIKRGVAVWEASGRSGPSCGSGGPSSSPARLAPGPPAPRGSCHKSCPGVPPDRLARPCSPQRAPCPLGPGRTSRSAALVGAMAPSLWGAGPCRASCPGALAGAVLSSPWGAVPRREVAPRMLLMIVLGMIFPALKEVPREIAGAYSCVQRKVQLR